jgi:hypothetical protein
MLNFTCEVDQRSRPLSGGVRFRLTPIDAQCALRDQAVATRPDLDRTYISVYDYAASQDTLRGRDRNPADIVSTDAGGSLITLGATGEMYISVFLSENGHSFFLADLNTALEVGHLWASLAIGPELESSDRFTLNQWLKGVELDQDYTLLSYKVPELGLVLRR